MSTCEGTFNHSLLNLQIHGCPWTVKAGNKCCQYGNAHVFHIYNLPHTTWTQPFPLTSFSLEPQVIQMSIMKQTSIIQWFYQVSSRDFGAMLSEVVLMLVFFSWDLSEVLGTMKVTDSNVIRFHLQILHGITVRSFDRKKDRLLVSGSKVFGVPLENLLRQYIPEFGLVPWWVREIRKFTQNSISEVNLVCFICCSSAFWWMLVHFFWSVLGL